MGVKNSAPDDSGVLLYHESGSKQHLQPTDLAPHDQPIHDVAGGVLTIAPQHSRWFRRANLSYSQ